MPLAHSQLSLQLSSLPRSVGIASRDDPDMIDVLQKCVAEHFKIQIEHSTFQIELIAHASHKYLRERRLPNPLTLQTGEVIVG